MAALSLPITQTSGNIATYWKISMMHINAITESITAEIAGYADQPSYANGMAPMTTVVEIMGPAQYAAILSSTSMITAFYTILSQTPDFAGSNIVS